LPLFEIAYFTKSDGINSRKKMKKYLLLLILTFISLQINAEINNKYGRFIGSFDFRALEDGRKLQLLNDLVFVDPKGKKWVAPKGYIVDGASIPRPLWSLIGSPFVGKYRMASVIHDVACEEKKRPWREVHKVFHYAMLASGVSSKRASIMYNAVYEGGPRWGKDAEKKLSDEQFKKLISNEKSEYLTRDLDIVFGELKSYSGAAMYTATKEGKPVVGVIKKYNNFTVKAEAGERKPTVGLSWERKAVRDMSNANKSAIQREKGRENVMKLIEQGEL